MKYNVQIRRVTVEDISVEVEADTEDLAGEAAKKKIEDGDPGDNWDLMEDELDVVSVEEVDTAPADNINEIGAIFGLR